MGLRAATHLLWASVLPNSPLRSPPPAFRQAYAKDKPDREKESLRPQDELDHAQGSGSLKKRRLLNCGSGQLPREAVVSLLLVPWHLELPQGRWAQVRMETEGVLCSGGRGSRRGSFLPGTKAGPAGSALFPLGLCILACMLVCVHVGVHTRVLWRVGGCPRSSPPGYPGDICPCSLAARFAWLTAPLLGAQHAPPSPSAGSGWPPSEDAIERICTLLGEVSGQVT